MSTPRSARLFLSPPHMSEEGHERRYVQEAFDTNWIAPVGPPVAAFEQSVADYTGIPHATALVSGTAALHLALVMLEVGPGDRVVCSSFTFSGSVNPIRYVGAEPVFIDSEPDSWNMDPALLERELKRSAEAGELPAAVIVVDLYGQCANYEAIEEICGRYEVPIVEDAAEALGATCRGRAAGSFGEMGVFSFNGNKIITTSGGGMLVSSNKRWTDRARHLSTQAREPAPHYQHEEVGYNYRLSSVCAAIGRGQMEVLERRVQRRRWIFERYADLLGDLPGVSFMPEAPWGRSNRWLTAITLDPGAFGADREQVRQALEAHNLEARPLWKPMHLQPVFRGCRMVGGAVSESLFEAGLCLPSGTAMEEQDIRQVAQVVRETGAKA